jgi:hypothetical protein
MKLLLLLLGTLFTSSILLAQDSWKVIQNGKIVLQTSQEDTAKNIINILKSSLKKKYELILIYNEEHESKGVTRYITAFGTNDHELNKQTGNRFKLNNPTLTSLFYQSKRIRIYTWALPSDPNMKASIRVRRVHLCTLVLK